MGEDVVGLVLPTDLLGLLPEVRQLLGQRAGWAEVEDILPRQGVIQEGVTDMGEQPVREKRTKKGSLENSGQGGREEAGPSVSMLPTPGPHGEGLPFVLQKPTL